MNIFYRKLKDKKKLHRTYRLPKVRKRAKDAALTHMCFYFYIVHFPINFSFVTSYKEGLLPEPRTSRNQRTSSLIQWISKMYGLYIFYEIRKLSAFYFTWVVLRKKKHMATYGVIITLNFSSHELGASLNNVSVFSQPKDIS